jgi:hypothetical protein
VPRKIAASKATPAQVAEAFVAMSAAWLCAVQNQAFQTRSDLEAQAATASKVALSAQQTKAMASGWRPIRRWRGGSATVSAPPANFPADDASAGRTGACGDRAGAIRTCAC